PLTFTLFPYTTLFRFMNGSRLRFPHSCFCCCCAFAHRRSPLQIGFQCCSKLFARQVTQFLSHALQRSQLAVRFFFRAWLQRHEQDRKSTRLNSSHVAI